MNPGGQQSPATHHSTLPPHTPPAVSRNTPAPPGRTAPSSLDSHAGIGSSIPSTPRSAATAPA